MGVTFKIMAVQVVGSSATNNVNYKNNYTFNNDDDEEVEIDNKDTPVINTDNLDDIEEEED